MNRKAKVTVIITILFIVVGVIMYLSIEPKGISIKSYKEYKESNFNLKFLKTINNNYKENYLVSPYSVKAALSMLREGANGETKQEIVNLLENNEFKIIDNKDVKIANAIFIKDIYKDKIKTDYTNLLSNKYNSEVKYDSFKTPDVINSWAKEKTDGMIPKVIDRVDPNFVIALANAIAIDVKWNYEFECDSTAEEEFYEDNKTTKKVEMMHNEYKTEDISYIKEENLSGILLPYKENEDNSLEFIALLPSGSIKDYIEKLSFEDLKNIDTKWQTASSKKRINLSLPRFKYEFSLDNFEEVLKVMGVKSAFASNKADFTNIMNKEDMNSNLYISDAVHKSYIDLNEKGTKAAAITYFGMKDNAIVLGDYENIDIKFNKPFLYFIRDKKTKEILFAGTVYQPNEWKGTTCSK